VKTDQLAMIFGDDH